VNKVARTHFWQTTRARSVLGYRPVVPRREGLRRMYAHFEARLLVAGFPETYRSGRRNMLALVLLLLIATVVWMNK
jgi:hypothetical protein